MFRLIPWRKISKDPLSSRFVDELDNQLVLLVSGSAVWKQFEPPRNKLCELRLCPKFVFATVVCDVWTPNAVAKQLWVSGVFDLTREIFSVRVIVLSTDLGGFGDDGCMFGLGCVEHVLIALHDGRNGRRDGCRGSDLGDFLGPRLARYDVDLRACVVFRVRDTVGSLAFETSEGGRWEWAMEGGLDVAQLDLQTSASSCVFRIRHCTLDGCLVDRTLDLVLVEAQKCGEK